MAIENFNVPLVCLFCGSTLEGNLDATFESGDLITCTYCGEENDYDSVLEIAKEKTLKQVKEAVEDEIKNTLKNIFKK